jgi:hypothetical protein
LNARDGPELVGNLDCDWVEPPAASLRVRSTEDAESLEA